MYRERQVSIVEKVKCTKCGSIGYTASPGNVRCSKCGGVHKVVAMTRANNKPIKLEAISYLQSLSVGNENPGTFCRD